MRLVRRPVALLIAVGFAVAVGAGVSAGGQDAPKPPASNPPASTPPKQEDLTNPITGSKPRPTGGGEEKPAQAKPGADEKAAKPDEKKSDDKGEEAPKTQTITAGGLTFDVPAGWVVETPTKSMFTPVAQFKLPAGKSGAAEDANMKVFTGIRGGVGPNVERWKAQITNPDKPAEEKDVKVNGLDVHVVYTGKGGFNAGMGMQGGGSVKQDYMILGAIVVTDDGDIQFKATGPAAILETEKPAWEALVKSIRVAK
ncbi:MAG: hypothetical protein ACKVZJ_00490 [Phycisphaerales bacterium]